MRHLVFPQCLAFLDALLKSPKFVKELAVPAFAEHLHRQQGLHWMFDARLSPDVHVAGGDDEAGDLHNGRGALPTERVANLDVHDVSNQNQSNSLV